MSCPVHSPLLKGRTMAKETKQAKGTMKIQQRDDEDVNVWIDAPINQPILSTADGITKLGEMKQEGIFRIISVRAERVVKIETVATVSKPAEPAEPEAPASE